MKRAALYVAGRIVIADSHLQAYESLDEQERNESIASGVLDSETAEFVADLARDHFYNKQIILIRHCQTEDESQTDPALSSDGWEQAWKLSDCLQRMGLDLSEFSGITSPFLRCLQTCSALNRNLRKTFRVDPDVMETPTFLREGQNFYVHNRAILFPDMDWHNTEDWVCGYESREDFKNRIKQVLHNIPEKSIIITHYGLIKKMVQFATCQEQVERVKMDIPQASITFIDRLKVECIGRICTYENARGCRCEVES